MGTSSDLINLSQSMAILEPHERIKKLASYGNVVEVDPNIPIIRYYRSGQEMIRMASVYLQEGNLENSYILFIKFMTLFIEKMKNHPNFKDPSIAEAKKINKQKLLEVMEKAEKIKAKLLERYKKEYEQFLKDRKLAEEARERELKNAKNKQSKDVVIPSVVAPTGPMPTAPDLTALDQVVYPNDFPSDPQRSNHSGPGGLILSDTKPQKPTFDRTVKPSMSFVEGGLRRICVPSDTMTKFLQVVNRNTVNNIETCGILAGQLKQHQLYVTHCILPKQSGTSDSCNTKNEEDIFVYQDQHNLITLGWIHTHPSQTAFLSSVDLHTQASYQILMAEAIAIVCAPKYQETGFYCLTPNYGLDYISQCRLDGFHPHPNEPPLYTEAPHYNLETTANITIVDLR